MNFVDKFKNMFNMSEEEYLDDVDIDDTDMDDEDYSKDVRSNFEFNHQQRENFTGNKVVEMRSSNPGSAEGSSRAHVVFKKLDRYDDAGSVADVLNEKKIVILNLETCPNDVSVRIIDFLNGVTYANNGEIKRVAARVFVIIPHNVSLSGELLEEMGNSNY